MAHRKHVRQAREQGWKTVTGKYDRFDHRSTTEPVSLMAYGGLDEVPNPARVKRLDRNQLYLKKNRIDHLLKAPLVRVIDARPAAPLLWLAQYFFLRSLRVRELVFQDGGGGDGVEGAADETDGEKKEEEADEEEADEEEAEDEEDPVGMQGQVLKFADHATVILYGTRHARRRGRQQQEGGARHSYTQESLEKCMDIAVTGLLLCRPANVCAWLAVEFCRQSPHVQLVSWAGRVVNTSRASGFVQEQAARHRRAAQPRAESPPPFSPARTMRPESPVLGDGTGGGTGGGGGGGSVGLRRLPP